MFSAQCGGGVWLSGKGFCSSLITSDATATKSMQEINKPMKSVARGISAIKRDENFCKGEEKKEKKNESVRRKGRH